MSESWINGPSLPGKKNSVPVYDVLSPPDGDSWDITILDSAVLGVEAHWIDDPVNGGGRSVGCTEVEGKCENCYLKRRKIWIGFVGCVHHGRNARIVLRMGPESVRRLLFFAAPHVGLRGLRLVARRVSKGIRQGLTFELSPLPPLSIIPTAHPIAPSVARVLAVQEIPDFQYGRKDREDIPDGN